MIHDRDEVDVIAMLRVTWHYKYFIALVAGVVGLVAVIVALTTTPIFRAEVVVTEARNGNIGAAASLANQLGGLASIAGINLAKSGADAEAPAVLRSRHLAEEFVRKNGLVTVLLPTGTKQPSLWFAVGKFRETVVSIHEDEDNGTTTITINWTDPTVAARWANEYVALANEMIRSRALNDSSRNIKYLKGQIAKTDVVEIQRVMYSLIEAETKTLMLANARKEYAFTVVDPAVVPEQRVWPRRTLMVLTGGALGIFIGIMLAFAHNVWRQYRAGG